MCENSLLVASAIGELIWIIKTGFSQYLSIGYIRPVFIDSVTNVDYTA